MLLLFFLKISNDCSLAIDRLDVVVVRAEVPEEDLVLVSTIGIFQNVLYFGVGLSALDHAPEGGVIEIVDVAVCLSPLEIVLQRLQVRVANAAPIEYRRLFELHFLEEPLPVEHEGCCKAGSDAGSDLIGATIEQLGLQPEPEGILVGLPIRDEDVLVLSYHIFGGCAHELNASQIVGLAEFVPFAELGEPLAVDAHNRVGFW